MPVDSMLVSAAVVAMFVVFAAVLAWGEFQTPPEATDSAARCEAPKRLTQPHFSVHGSLPVQDSPPVTTSYALTRDCKVPRSIARANRCYALQQSRLTKRVSLT
jgi:hypothetical protein